MTSLDFNFPGYLVSVEDLHNSVAGYKIAVYIYEKGDLNRRGPWVTVDHIIINTKRTPDEVAARIVSIYEKGANGFLHGRPVIYHKVEDANLDFGDYSPIVGTTGPAYHPQADYLAFCEEVKADPARIYDTLHGVVTRQDYNT